MRKKMKKSSRDMIVDRWYLICDIILLMIYISKQNKNIFYFAQIDKNLMKNLKYTTIYTHLNIYIHDIIYSA